MSDALNRTSKQLVRNIEISKYDITDWIIDPDLTALEGVLNIYWNISGDLITEMNQADKDAVDALTPIDEYREVKQAQIDLRTGELIATGYNFAGKQFSLSANAQTNILAMFATKDHPLFTYPVGYNTIDDHEVFSIDSSATLEGMYMTALGTKKAYLDSGTDLKAAVRAATTKAEVDAIVDPR